MCNLNLSGRRACGTPRFGAFLGSSQWPPTILGMARLQGTSAAQGLLARVVPLTLEFAELGEYDL